MKMTATRFTTVVLISAGVAFLLLNQLNPAQSLNPSQAVALFPPQTRAEPLHFSNNGITQGFTHDVSPAAKTIVQMAPHVAELREEVRKNPEGAPIALLAFASTMGKRFQIARLSQTNASSFFEELYSCLSDSQPIAVTARALCLREGEKLTLDYPVLKNNYDLLVQRASPDVRHLAFSGRNSPRSSR